MSNNISEYAKLYSFLLAKVKAGHKNLSILCHDSPDPDAMASAMALQEMATRAKIKANIYYDGEINHSQNRAMINVLDIKMFKISGLGNGSREEHIEFVKDSLVAVVDTSYFAKGNCVGICSLLEGMEEKFKPCVIIDHHGYDITDVEFILNKSFGSCSTIMALALKDSKTKINKRLATALFLGLMFDSNQMKNQDITEQDQEIHDYLEDKINLDSYMRIVNCPKSRTLLSLEGLAKGEYLKQNGNAMVAGTGFVNSAHRALLGDLSDNLMLYETVETVVVLGIIDSGIDKPKYLVASFRRTGDILDANEFVKKIFGKDNAAGRKGVAGAQLELSDVLNKTIDQIDNEEDKNALFKIIFSSYAKIIFRELQISS